MAKAIEQLLVLQACDQEIRRLRKEMEDIPLRKQQIESRLGAHKEGQAQAEHVLLEARAKIKHLEGEIESARQTIKKYRDQQLQIKSNVEYKALEKEVALSIARRLRDWGWPLLDAQVFGLNLVIAGHYETERVVLAPLIRRLQNECFDVQYTLSRADGSPFVRL